MENVVMITFDVEAQAYQAFSQLKNDSVNSAYTILQMAVIKNGDGKIVPVDGFDSGIDSTDDTWTGGLIGSAVGILGRPLAVLLGASMPMLWGYFRNEWANLQMPTTLDGVVATVSSLAPAILFALGAFCVYRYALGGRRRRRW